MADTVTDNIHPWVEARVWAFDHPYFAVTDAAGNFAISQAPWARGGWWCGTRRPDTAAGRLGTRIEIAPEAAFKPFALESPRWGE